VYVPSEESIRRLLPTIDYSEALTVDATVGNVIDACAAGRRYGFRAVVTFPCYLEIVAQELADSGVRAQLPVGFPSGAATTWVKCREVEEGIKKGATDFDMVMNIGALKSKDYSRVLDDIQQVRKLIAPTGSPLKVIIEVGLLTEEEMVTAATIVAESGATHVKTCTGFAPGRATLHIIRLLKDTVGGRIEIKASGGVASVDDGCAFLDAGASVVAARGWLVSQLESQGYKPATV
jgi:deoxyribose-phosphate aldolase